jgi:hypothetical protein
VIAKRVTLITLLLFSTAAFCAPNSHSKSCPITKGNGYTPEGEPPEPNRYGTRALSTILSEDGTIVFRPGGAGFVLPDGSLKMKLPWWKEKGTKFSITGRRLDATALPLRAEFRDSTDFEMVATYIIFPTPGCWEVTGKAGDATLRFVTSVVKIERGP